MLDNAAPSTIIATADSIAVHTPGIGRIVGVGASAGGLESLEQLFGSLPPDTGMAFIVVQHLSPDFRSLMDELIARHSEMPVVVAEDGMAVHPNHIYLMPPRKEMIIRDRHLVLTDKEPHTFSLPIDTFFRSLAQDVGPDAVAIVLSGSGSDGSRGVQEVKHAGGLVMAQSPASAKFDSMPLAAAATGVVDHVYPPRDLGRVLCGLPPSEPSPDAALLSDDPAMDAILRMLRDQYGIDFSLYKTTTIGRRIQRRADLARMPSLQAFVDLMLQEPAELSALYHDLLIGVTQFFRDPEAFAYLEREVIPSLLDRVPPDQELRIWVAGCATGEEAYTLAILLFEAFTERKRPLNVKILATDVHQPSLEHAGAGIYSEAQLTQLTAERRSRFFNRRSSGYQVSQDLRQLIVFARHNVTKDAPFTKMHLISCRNMLIYFQPQPQRTVISLFHFGLASGGVLFLGASETPGALAEEFTTLDEHCKVYRKRRDVHLLSQVRLPMNRASARPVVALEVPRGHGPDPMILSTYDQLLDLFMPPSFLVDEHRSLVDSYSGAEKLLKVRSRRPTTNLLELLDDELRSVVGGAVQRAFRENTRLSYSGVRVTIDGRDQRCTLTATPLTHPRTSARHVLVAFQPTHANDAQVEPDDGPTPIPLSDASRQQMQSLETELAYTRETLQATIEELETSNEEMQATNEELVASNEELQSTNEELHSVNEELYTVNAEYQQKIAELKELNTDMAHLLEGTDVGTVFLDHDLRIRRFTSRIASVFRFQRHDVGRRISDFSHNIERPGLMEEIVRAGVDGTTVEDEVRDSAGTPFFLRILPYRVDERTTGKPTGLVTEPAPIKGVVLTLTDMTALDKARSRLAQLSAIVESSDDAIVGKSLDGTIVTWNRGAEKLYGYTADEVLGQHARMLMQAGHEGEFGHLVQAILRGDTVKHATSCRVRKDGTPITVAITVSPIFGQRGQVAGISTIGRDVSPMLRAQRELEERQQKIELLLLETEEIARRREQFLAMLSHELRNPLAAVMHAGALLAMKPQPSVVDVCQSVIERQTGQMKRLLEDLLDVSRITRGTFELQLEPVDLRGAIDAALEAVGPLYTERGVTLRRTPFEVTLPIHGDPNRLMQVMVNLLSNAANYSPRSSVVELDIAVTKQHAVISVIDQGVGIEPELRGKIFELFVQSEQRLDRSRGGLGVGLSLAKNIVELHDGTIEVHSEGTGRGSTFVVRLPLSAPLEPRAALAPPALHDRCRVLVVDDQEDARAMLKMLLESRDHVVVDAPDGFVALQLLSNQPADIAFIDIGLPAMDGYEVAQRIRKQADLAGVTLVALSGYGSPNDVAAALAAGFDHHLIKPAPLAKLEEILAKVAGGLGPARQRRTSRVTGPV
ncbi:MAG: PAS domain S-box protein, partial [Deltaproteobacteria bacterium]|nr:PAS domain S-box protein [Deltaproteobacteria bacterium]